MSHEKKDEDPSASLMRIVSSGAIGAGIGLVTGVLVGSKAVGALVGCASALLLYGVFEQEANFEGCTCTSCNDERRAKKAE